MGLSLQQTLSQRDSIAWLRRGLQLLFIFGIASLMAAIVTFTAHNFTYLSTVGKLTGLGALLIAAAGLWVHLGVRKTTGAVMAGLTAQLLIGVWLAAAGQLYQAPGGLQDLLIIWAVLGLPFALASRHAAHWAMWLALIVGISLTKNGSYFYDFIGSISYQMRIITWAIIFSVICAVGVWRKAPIWLITAIALVASGFLIVAILIGAKNFTYFWMWMIAAIIAFGLTALLYKQKHALGALCLFTLVTLAAPVSLLIRAVNDAMSGLDYVGFLLLTVIFGAATFVMIRIFMHYRKHFGAKTERSTDVKIQEDSLEETEDKSPWYMDVFIALGGILTAIFATAFIGTLLAAILAISGLADKLMVLIGLAIYAVFLTLRVKRVVMDKNSPYLTYLFGTMVIVGQITAITGLVIMTERISNISQWAWFSILLAVPVLWLVPQRVMQVIQSAIISIAIFVIVYHYFDGPHMLAEPILIILLSGGAGFCFFTRSKGHWRLTAAIIFLIAAMFAGLFNPDFLRETQGVLQGGLDALWPMILHAASFAIALTLFAFAGLKRSLPPWPILVAITVIVGLLPGGAAGAALILLIGYAAGLRSFFIIGSVAALYFLFAAYYDLRLTLLELSGVLALSGIILLGIYHASRRRLGGELLS